MSEAFVLLIKNIANLFKVKTILSLLVIVTTCLLTYKNVVSVEAFMAIAASIITYYFTREDDKETIQNVTKQNETKMQEEITKNQIKESEE